uniref:hypothetical protein n=1 Tax=uncultured Draconibacterium sp. TaxID=1573823 RepID=UPI003216DB49
MTEKEERYNNAWLNPAGWLGKAENHIISAECLNNRYVFLFKDFDKTHSSGTINEQIALLETVPFLCGIAIENAIKALIIHRNSDMKTQEELITSKQWKTNHDILTMLENENIVFDKTFIKRIQKALIWSGKYPLPSTKQLRHDKDYNLHEYSSEDVNTTKELVSQIKQLIQTQ